MKSKKITKIVSILALSVLLHLMFFFGFGWLQNTLFWGEIFKRLDHTVVDKTKDLSAQIELVDLKNAKQIVEQNPRSANKEKPKEAKFLSAEDQTVEKETKAALNGAFKNSKPELFLPPRPQSTPAPKVVLQPKITSETLGLKGFKPSLDPNQRQAQLEPKPLVAPSPVALGSGPSQTDDDLQDIEKGANTQLNTEKYEFFSYFSRIKGQLRGQWNPLIRRQVAIIFHREPDRSPSHLGRKKTSLRVTLTQEGYLDTIELLATSGDKSIDGAAIQAFRQAAPFLNPPKDLLEKDQKIRFFWSFILDS